MRICLLRDGLKERQVHQVHQLAETVTHADHRSQILVDGVLRCGEGIVAVHIYDGRVLRDSAGPFDVEVGFGKIVLAPAGIGALGDQHHLRRLAGQFEPGPKILDIFQIDARLAYDDDLLSRSVDLRGVERRHVVDGGDVIGREAVTAIAGGILGR